MFDRLKVLFHRKSKIAPELLHIDGVKTPLTPRPDKAEEAATALLDMLTGNVVNEPQGSLKKLYGHNTTEYYHALAHRIQINYEREQRGAQRILAYCEEQLANPVHKGMFAAQLENELFSVQVVVEREKGELFDRWQHCLAMVTMMQMEQCEELSKKADLT